MPFKMTSPLTKMATTAMKTVQKSAMKLKDLNNDGKTTKADLLIKKGVYNKDGSPATLRSPDEFKKASAVKSLLKPKSTKFAERTTEKGNTVTKEDVERAKGEFNLTPSQSADQRAEKVAANNSDTIVADAQLEKIKEKREKAAAAAAEAEKKKKEAAAEKKTDLNKKITYSQAWDNMTDAAKGKYKSKADFIKAAKAYNVKIGKTKKPTATIPKETVTTGPTAKEVDNQAKTDVEPTKTELLAKQKELAKKKAQLLAEAAAEKKKKEAAAAAAKAEAKKNKKLTPKERRKAERNIKAQEKANKKIRKGGGQQIKVDEKNTTATAADRRKLKQGAKQLEEKLSLKRIELEKNKPKNKKEDKKGKNKKGKNKKKKGKNSNSTSQLGGSSRVAGR